VGKSTLFNRLAGEAISLIDNTPGLTRDRKEAIVKLFGMKIRLVDTAGIDDFEEKISYDELLNKTIFQTRQALIYSDLAFFLLDGKAGVTHNDIKLAKWLNNLKKKDEKISEESEISSNLNETSSAKFYEKLKKIKEQDDIKIPKIILVANKVEDDFIPEDIFCDFSRLNLGDPLLISAQQGDNMHDIYNIIEENIPEEVKQRYQNKVEKRVNRYDEYKEKMKQIFIESLNSFPLEERVKYSLSDWEDDFDYLNKRDIEDNSDYDSDNDIDPIDTFVQVPKDQNLRENIRKTKKEELKSIQNKMHSLKYLKKPIKIAVVGKQNVGKSSIVNSLLKENRVIISDVPGTTRDSVPIEWNYKGRRLILIDTAGLQAKNKVHDKVNITSLI
jgi:GTP-binding protein